MRRFLTLTAVLVLAIPAVAQAAGMTVPLNQTRRVIFVGSAANVVVGNPDIADVNVIDSRNLMVVGKKFGVTNLVVLDTGGRTLFNSEIIVSAGAGSVVSIYRGAAPSDYACTPWCQQVSGEAGLQTPAPVISGSGTQIQPAPAQTPAP